MALVDILAAPGGAVNPMHETPGVVTSMILIYFTVEDIKAER